MKNLILLSLFFTPIVCWSQMIPIKGEQKPVSFNQPINQVDNSESNSPNVPFVKSFMDEPFGLTRYDFQSNASIMNRLINHGNGELTAVWTMGQADPGFTDRGTGYNRREGGLWGDVPQGRIEDVRTGWPSIVVTEDGTELVVSHDFGQGNLVTSRRAPGETDWTQSVVSSDVPIGQLWPQMAAGEGNTVHLIAITSLGSTYEGVEGHLLYYRSPDAGLTWEVQDFIVPGLDSTDYIDYRQSDSYKIAANGNTVAIARFAFWEDVVVFRSDDNGDNWEKTVIYDFPLDKYVVDTGYEREDLPQDDFAPDAFAIYSSGNSGNVIIDNESKLHLFFNSLYVIDDNLTDQVLQYFPCTNGIVYWNEAMGENSIRTIAAAVDADGSGFLELDCLNTNFSHRYSSLTTAPNAGIDQENNLYLTYASITENYFSETASPGRQHYRHIYAIASLDGGETWSPPLDLIEETVDESILGMVNADFPTVALDVDDKMHIMYQQDFEPGNIIADGDAAGENRMTYIGLDVSNFGVVSSKDHLAQQHLLKLSPNPARNFSDLFLDQALLVPSELTVYNLAGHRLHQERLYPGQSSYRLSTEQFTSGVYLIELRNENAVVVEKLIIE